MKKIILIIFAFVIFIVNIDALTESVIDITNYNIFNLQEAIFKFSKVLFSFINLPIN